MTLPVTIGKTSAALDYSIDLAELPNLFVSYCDESQVVHLYRSFLKDLAESTVRNETQFAIGETRSSAWVSSLVHVRYSFHQGNTAGTRDALMQGLSREMKQRRALRRKLGAEPFSNTCPYLVVFLHDVFDLVLSPKKAVGITFLQLLLLGKELKIHTVAASCSTYRNLLRQFMQLNPIIKAKFRKSLGEKSLYIPQSLGAELILNADNFSFFRSAEDLDYKRLYPVESLPQTEPAWM